MAKKKFSLFFIICIFVFQKWNMPKRLYMDYLDRACNMSVGSYIQTDIDYSKETMNSFSTSIRAYIKSRNKSIKLVFRIGHGKKIKFWRIE